MDNFFTPGGSLESNISNSRMDESVDLLAKLYKNSKSIDSELSDKKAILKFIESRNNGEVGTVYSAYNNPNLDRERLIKSTFDDGGNGLQISGVAKKYSKEELQKRGFFDYRVTIKNSDEITTDEAIAFVKALVIEANKRQINLRAKNYWESDAIILYCDTEYLADTVKLLDDLGSDTKYGELVNSATKHFGAKIPFGVVPKKDSYYGISMAHCETRIDDKSPIFSSTYGRAVGTFNGYMSEALNSCYDALYQKYNGDCRKISVEEMYNDLMKYHKNYMLGNSNTSSDIPLWMNRRNYEEMIDYMARRDINKSNSSLKNNWFTPGGSLSTNNGRRI